jgi:hypothetical protein
MNKQLAIKKDGYELAQPTQMLEMANVLKRYVVDQKLYTTIQGKNYVHVEGWQFAGGLLGTYPRIIAIENLSTGNDIKWRADAEIIDLRSGNVISRGFAICSKNESKKKAFDEYAILSMAQTRAIGKAYRNVIGWVMKVAGYEATPHEEMTRVGDTTSPSAEPTVQLEDEPAAHLVCHGLTKSGCGEDITQQEYDYSKKIYGKPLCRKHQKEAPRPKK